MLDPVVAAFIDHFDLLPPKARDRDALCRLADAFARLPYENLSKLVSKHERAGADRRRAPAQVLSEHLALGTGGTCFSLTTLFLRVLHALGFEARVALCDGIGRHGLRPDRHCAVIVTLSTGPYLVDPGYLIHEPIPLLSGQRQSLPRHIALRGEAVGAGSSGVLALSTYGKARYQLKLSPVSAKRFLAVWDASFEWTMMNDVHVSATLGPGGGYAYLHGHKLRLSTPSGHCNENLAGRQTAVLAERFGLDPGLVERAYAIVAAATRGTP